MYPATQKMEDVAVDRHKPVFFIKLSDKAASRKCIEPEENSSGLQPPSISLTATCSDEVITRDADHERQRKSQTRMWVEWIFVGLAITAVWLLIVGLPIVLYYFPQVRPRLVIEFSSFFYEIVAAL